MNTRGLVGIPNVLQLSADRADVFMWGRRVSNYSAAIQCLLVFVGGMSIASAMGVLHFDFPVESVLERSFLLVFSVVGLIIAAIGAAGIVVLPSARPLNVSFISPFFPYLPLLAIAVNLFLLASLDKWTWVRFVVWCALGTAIYLGYGIKHSTAAAVGAEVVATHSTGSINDEDDTGETSTLMPKL